MRRIVLFTLAFALIAVSVLAARSDTAAAPPEPKLADLPCAENVSVQLLGAGFPHDFEGQKLVLARVILDVGGSLGPHTHPGTLVASIESGTFGFTLVEDGEMPIFRSGDAGAAPVEEMITTGQEVVMKPGDVFIEMGMVHSARAIGDEPAVVILSGLIEDGQALTQCVEETPTS